MGVKRCTKCLMPENYPDISFDSDGACDFCRGERHLGAANLPEVREQMARKDALREDFEQAMAECKGRSDYDCLVPISGGKDSAYLLWLLKEKYGLKLLAFSVDTGLLSPVARPNIRRMATRLDVDHMFFTPHFGFFKKLYRHYLRHPNLERCGTAEPGHVGTTCRACSTSIHSMALMEASRRSIPLVTLGYSPDQIEHHFYEVPQEEIRGQSWVPEPLHEAPFDEADRACYWDPGRIGLSGAFPRLLFPFHVIDYPGRQDLIRQVTEMGLVRKGKSRPVVTNCWVNWVLTELDIRKMGYNPYVPFLSDSVRSGAEKRGPWVALLNFARFMTRTGLNRKVFRRRKLDHVLRKLELTWEDLD